MQLDQEIDNPCGAVAHQSEPRLSRLLRRQAHANGHNLTALAKHLGVTPGYLTQLRNRSREERHISRAFAASCADYLETSTISVLLAAQALDLADFVSPTEGAAARRRRQLHAVLDSPAYGALIDAATLLSAAPSLQALVVHLHADVTRPAEASSQPVALLRDLDTPLQPLAAPAAPGHAEACARRAASAAATHSRNAAAPE